MGKRVVEDSRQERVICGVVGCRISHDSPNGRINSRKMMPRPTEVVRLRNFVKPIMFFDVGQILRDGIKIVYEITGWTIPADVSAALQFSDKTSCRKFNVCYRVSRRLHISE